MCRFSMPAAMKYEDRAFVYEHLYGLKEDQNGGCLKKATYHFCCAWIHITGGSVDEAAISKIATLTSEQKAIILVTLHRNPKRYTQHAYTTAFLHSIRSKLFYQSLMETDLINKKNANLVSSCASFGDHILLGKVLELKPRAKVNSQNYNGYSPLMLAAIVGDVDSSKLLLAKGANINEKYSTGLEQTLLDVAVECSEKGKNRDDIFNFLSEQFDRETRVKAIQSSGGLQNLSLDVYKETLPKLNLTKKELASLIYQENKRANSDKMPFFLELILAKPKAESNEFLLACDEKFNKRIENYEAWLRKKNDPEERRIYNKLIQEERDSLKKFKGLIKTARGIPLIEVSETRAA